MSLKQFKILNRYLSRYTWAKITVNDQKQGIVYNKTSAYGFFCYSQPFDDGHLYDSWMLFIFKNSDWVVDIHHVHNMRFTTNLDGSIVIKINKCRMTEYTNNGINWQTFLGSITIVLSHRYEPIRPI